MKGSAPRPHGNATEMEESFEHLINCQSSLSLPCVNLQSAIWGDEFMRTVSDSCLDLDLFTAELRAA